jgi:hypothetical protein
MIEACKKDIRDIEAISDKRYRGQGDTRARVDAVMARIRRVPPLGKKCKTA